MGKAWIIFFMVYLGFNVFVTTAGWFQSLLVNAELLKRIHELESEAKNDN